MATFDVRFKPKSSIDLSFSDIYEESGSSRPRVKSA